MDPPCLLSPPLYKILKLFNSPDILSYNKFEFKELMHRKLSRMEANKEVRRVLNRHSVDLGYTQYSVAGMDVRLTGWLCKVDTTDFNAAQIETMIQEFQRRLPNYTISGDFENWNFNTDHIIFLGDRTTGNDENERHYTEEEPTDFDPEGQ